MLLSDNPDPGRGLLSLIRRLQVKRATAAAAAPKVTAATPSPAASPLVQAPLPLSPAPVIQAPLYALPAVPTSPFMPTVESRYEPIPEDAPVEPPKSSVVPLIAGAAALLAFFLYRRKAQ